MVGLSQTSLVCGPAQCLSDQTAVREIMQSGRQRLSSPLSSCHHLRVRGFPSSVIPPPDTAD